MFQPEKFMIKVSQPDSGNSRDTSDGARRHTGLPVFTPPARSRWRDDAEAAVERELGRPADGDAAQQQEGGEAAPSASSLRAG